MKKNEMDMCSGPLFFKMLKFTIPIILTVILQQLFNTADLIVVGKFGHPGALAAVGATGPAVNLLVNFFSGFSLGAGICMARFYGAKNLELANKCVHTSVLLSLIGGSVLAAIGILFTRPLLLLMSTPADIIDQSVLYMRIYFAGMPFIMLFNFCASILRSVGDSNRTLYYIASAGVINVLLNLIFVIALDLNIAGVAIATVISQLYSAFMCIRCFFKYDGCLHLEPKKLRIDARQLKGIASQGIPCGIQNSLFSLSNAIIQSSINSFGTTVMSGNTAASNIEAYIFFVLNSIGNTTTNFASQNFGAGNFKRIKKVMLISLAMISVCGAILGFVIKLFSNSLLGLYTNIPAEIEIGILRISLVVSFQFLCGYMEVFSSLLKGINHPASSTLVSLIGACFFRIFWIFTVFAKYRRLEILYISYPISWFCTAVFLAILFFYFIKKDEKAFNH